METEDFHRWTAGFLVQDKQYAAAEHIFLDKLSSAASPAVQPVSPCLRLCRPEWDTPQQGAGNRAEGWRCLPPCRNAMITWLTASGITSWQRARSKSVI